MQNCKENITSSAVHNIIKRVQQSMKNLVAQATRLRINAKDFWAPRGASLKTGMTVSWKYLYGVCSQTVISRIVPKFAGAATNAG